MHIIVNSRIYQEKYSGIQNYLFNVYSRIGEFDTKNNYTFVQTNPSKTLGKTDITGGIFGKMGKAFFDALLVVFAIKRLKGDIFHAPSFVLPLLKPRGCKYVVTIHDLAFLVYPEQYPWIFRTYMYFATLNSVKRADVIISISESTKRDLLRYYPGLKPSKIQVIPLGVAPVFFEKTTTEPLIKGKYFFSLTTHPKRKNILRMLDIMGAHPGVFSPCKYVIAGILKGESLAIIKQKVREHGLEHKVILYGYANLDEVRNLYAYAEFLLYPSYYEGFGLPVLEAMASGCPVISSNTSSLPEVNPRPECLFDPYKNRDILAKMQYIFNLPRDRRENLIRENQAFARGLTWDNTIEKTVEIFNTL